MAKQKSLRVSPLQMKMHGFLMLILVLIVLFGAGWMRLQTIPQLKGEYLFDTDSFRFYRQAEIIYQQGFLPSLDMERW